MQGSYFLLLLLLIPVYWLVSLVLLLFPNLVWKRHRRPYPLWNELCDSDRILCIGHRGGSQEGPENTMDCFERTDEVCDMFELDVIETRDRQLVVHHDLGLLRTCGVDRQIAELDYSQLPRYQPVFDLHFSTLKGKGNNARIILLRELFERFPNKPLNIELKSPTPTAMAELDRLVRQHRREHITVWGCMSAAHGDLVRKNPHTESFRNIRGVLRVFALYVLGLLPFCCVDSSFFEMPLFSQDQLDWVRAMRGGGCLISLLACLAKFINCISGGLIRHLKKRGIPTFAFVLNTEEGFRLAKSKGCAGIMTDVPSAVREFLSSHTF